MTELVTFLESGVGQSVITYQSATMGVYNPTQDTLRSILKLLRDIQMDELGRPLPHFISLLCYDSSLCTGSSEPQHRIPETMPSRSPVQQQKRREKWAFYDAAARLTRGPGE